MVYDEALMGKGDSGMFLKKVKIRNWKNFSSMEVDLGQINYLIGANASGKSNFLDIFRFLRDIVKIRGGGLQLAVDSRGGFGKIRSLAARRAPTIEFFFEFGVDFSSDSETLPLFEYSLSLANEERGLHRVIVKEESVKKGGKTLFSRPNKADKEDPERMTQTFLEQINENKNYREIVHFFGGVLYLHLVPQLLKYPSLGGNILEDDPFGQGFLQEIAATPQRTRVSRLKKIEKVLSSVIPNFNQLEFKQDPITGWYHLEMRYLHWRPNAGWQREDQFSDGTLRLVALCWILLNSNPLILLEEPELSLHEAIVRQLPALIYSLFRDKKRSLCQLIATTHSEGILGNPFTGAHFLYLKPGQKGESTTVHSPDENDLLAMRSGLTPADVLLPKTSELVGNIVPHHSTRCKMGKIWGPKKIECFD